MEVKSDGLDEEMKDDIDFVRGLLDRLKDDKERELLKESPSSSVNEDGYRNSVGENLVGELVKKSATLVMNLKPVSKTRDSATKMGLRDAAARDDKGDPSGKGVSQKRKQDAFLVEVQERAEVISKSARKAPETVVSSIGQDVEGDPDTVEFLRKIRAAPSSSNDFRMEGNETRPFRRKSASEVDLSVVVSNSSTLNLEVQKSKIPLARSGSLKDRRRPSAASRRKSLRSSLIEDLDDSVAISEGEESMDEDRSVTSGGSFIIKNSPQSGAGDVVRPRTKPKPKVKSQTVSGIALPGLADALNKKQVAAENRQRSQGSAADIVRAAAENKNNMAAKEEKLEKDNEKPAWLVEAEARRKLHEERRHPKSKEHGESQTSRGSEKTVINGPVLRSLPQRHEAVKDKSVSGEAMNVLHNVVLRPVRKPEAVPTNSDNDSDATKSSNVCLRPVSKPGPLDDQAEIQESERSKPRNILLRPLPKPEPAVNENTEDTKGSFQPVRLKPIVYPRLARPSGSSITNGEATPMRKRSSYEETSSSSPPVKPITQSFTRTVTSTRSQENGVVTDQRSSSVQSVKSSREYHTVRPLTPITLEPKVSENSSPHINGERVTISSNYLSGPHKLPPKTTPKPSNKSKTVTVTASEVPELSSVRRTSVELIHAKVERKSSRLASSVVPNSHKSYGDLSGSRRGSDPRDRAEIFDSAFRPTYTGDVLPQWKIDLLEKKKNTAASRGGASKDRPHQTHITNAVVVPPWKKELAEKRKQRTPVNGNQAPNKENEPSSSLELPQWQKELAERRKRREILPGQEPPEKSDSPPERPEWQRRLKNTRRNQPIVAPKAPSEDSADSVPSFIKEFEKKKRTFPRGGSTNSSYV